MEEGEEKSRREYHQQLGLL
ncbi:hypothetical protein Goarm_020345 [Gossypium armourianum]|uniref:Uncharacterized protein n=1 Tax=Gossypium armourianum TaxID=34283 RepID=A0A7J9INC2_9ROSI|nr:hypothetical protein [Gossypium armourianum]